jgi:hypothetical protein
MDWETVVSGLYSTRRLPVPGGWIYSMRHNNGEYSSVFVPFPPAPQLGVPYNTQYTPAYATGPLGGNY